MNVDDILRPRGWQSPYCQCVPKPTGKPQAIVYVNGTRAIQLYCPTCDKQQTSNISHKAVRQMGYEPSWVPVRQDNLGNSVRSTICARCGNQGPVELHHFAPYSLFEDPDDWPTALLCPPCHREWHHRTGLANGRTS